MLSAVFLLVILLLTLVWFFFRRSSDAKVPSIPGVKASDPELGNLGDIGQAGSLHQYLTSLHQKYGPIVSFYWNRDRVVSIASPEAFQETRRLFDRPIPLFAAFEPFIGPKSIQYANGEEGRYRRKAHYDAALSPVALRAHFFQIFENVLREQLKIWQSHAQRTVSLHKEMLTLAIRSITSAAFGSRNLYGEEGQIEAAYNTCWHEMELRIQGQATDEKREREFQDARGLFLREVKEILNERREHSGDQEKCFVDYLLADEEHVRTDEHICDEIITMFVGGFHTTGNLLTWVLYYLAKDQTVQQRLYEELVRTYQTEFPTFEQIDQMPYLANVIDESLRLSVLAPWGARVSFEEDIKICGYTVPAGTSIIQALGVVLHDGTIWRKPEEFNPDRFNQENKKALPPLAFSPFGFAGKRICPGYRFAQYEASVFIAGIIRAFKVTLVDLNKAVVPVHGLVTSPKEEIDVKFIRRNESDG